MQSFPSDSNGDWDQSFLVPQEVKSEISIWLTVLNQWNGKEISLFPNFDNVLTTDASESGAGATLKKGNTIIKTWSLQWSQTNPPCHQTVERCSLYYWPIKQCGQIQDLSILFEQLWKQCLKKKITLIGEHIPGFFNVKADHLGRLSGMNHTEERSFQSHPGWILNDDGKWQLVNSERSKLNTITELPFTFLFDYPSFIIHHSSFIIHHLSFNIENSHGLFGISIHHSLFITYHLGAIVLFILMENNCRLMIVY
ncbi:hypothetical protein ACTA71_006601 [Dictyostelium dimigraforme]